jgi:hypothetical protein
LVLLFLRLESIRPIQNRYLFLSFPLTTFTHHHRYNTNPLHTHRAIAQMTGRSRTRRSVIFGLHSVEPVNQGKDSATSPPQPSRRSSSLLLDQEHTQHSSPAPTSVAPVTIRHYRSMLEVEAPPFLDPMKPMSYDELYEQPLNTEIQTPYRRPTSGAYPSFQALKCVEGRAKRREFDCQHFPPFAACAVLSLPLHCCYDHCCLNCDRRITC